MKKKEEAKATAAGKPPTKEELHEGSKQPLPEFILSVMYELLASSGVAVEHKPVSKAPKRGHCSFCRTTRVTSAGKAVTSRTTLKCDRCGLWFHRECFATYHKIKGMDFSTSKAGKENEGLGKEQALEEEREGEEPEEDASSSDLDSSNLEEEDSEEDEVIDFEDEVAEDLVDSDDEVGRAGMEEDGGEEDE